MAHLHQGQSAAFWRPVPCGNSDQMGSAMNYPVQLLVVSQQGTEFKKQALSPMDMTHSSAHFHQQIELKKDCFSMPAAICKNDFTLQTYPEAYA